MFKKGDVVECISIPDNDGKWILGERYTVGSHLPRYGNEYPEAISDEQGAPYASVVCSERELMTWNTTEEFHKCFELVKENNMFKKGDLVRSKTNSSWTGPMSFVEYRRDISGICRHPQHGLGGFLIKDLELVKENNMKINYHVLNESIILNYDSKTVTVASDDARYEEVLNCIREERLQDIPGVVEIERRYNGGGIELKDGLLTANGEALPVELEDRIIKFKAAKLPYQPLLNFWEKLKKNPSFNARKMLFAFLEHNGHSFTQDGDFIAYRGVTEDFKDKHSGKFDNSPGQICEMDRNLVDDNPNNTCSAGLHVACFDYAKGFGEKLVEVLVNPMDVVCVPVDYDGTKMRVCRFEVIAECKEMNTELVKKLATDTDEAEIDAFQNDSDEDVEYARDEVIRDAEMELERVQEEYDERVTEALENYDERVTEALENYRYARRDKTGRFTKKSRK